MVKVPEVEAFDDAVYEEQCQVSSYWTGARITVMCSMFLFGAFTFAYFYLRTLNNHNDWRVGNETPSMILGVAIAACVVGSWLVHYMSARRLQEGSRVDWVVGGVFALGLLVTGCGLQVWELTRLPFDPASSGYTSVFIAWMPIYIMFLLGQAYWLETLLAQAVARPRSAMTLTDDGHLLIVPRFGASIEGYVLFSEFMVVAAIEILLLFYVF